MDQPDRAWDSDNRYNFIESRRSGGFAEVGIYWDSRMQRRVAIKRIPLDGHGSMAALREARTAAMLAHPNMVTVYDFHSDDDDAYIIMENVEGMDLYEYENADTDEGLSYDEIAYVAESLGAALSFAHENGVLHLDVKPANILIDRDARIKLTDFGVAELTDSLGFEAATGGTHGYMSPEQAAGRPVSTASDVYSLAAVLYELLTGEVPMPRSDVAGDGVPLPPSTWDDSIPDGIDDILLTALDPNPSFRMQDVRDLVADLLEYVGDPATGEHEMAENLRLLVDDDPDYEEDPTGDFTLWEYLDDSAARRVGLITRSYPEAANLILRFVTAGVSGYLTYLGLGVTDLRFQPVVMAVVVALVGIFGFVIPRAGALIGLIAVGIGAILSGSVLMGVTMIVTVIAWWIGEGRISEYSSTVVGSPAVVGLFRGLPLPSLVAGLMATPGRAALITLAMSLSGVFLAALTGADALGSVGTRMISNSGGVVNERMLALLAHPRTWICLAGWVMTAAAVSALLRMRSTAVVFLSPIVGTILLMITELIAIRVENGGIQAAPEPAVTAVIIMSGILLLCMIVLFGVPAAPYADEDVSAEA